VSRILADWGLDRKVGSTRMASVLRWANTGNMCLFANGHGLDIGLVQADTHVIVVGR
jgi:hypothetical protein